MYNAEKNSILYYYKPFLYVFQYTFIPIFIYVLVILTKIKVYNPIKVIHFNIFRRNGLLIVFDILNDIADCLDGFNSFIGDLEVEFFLKAHNEVYNVEGVCAEVVLNVSA